MEHNRIVAAGGLNMMFMGQAVGVVALVLAIAAGFAALLSKSGGLSVLMLLFALAALAGGIIVLVGLVQCRDAHLFYRYAVYTMVVNFVLSMALALLGLKDTPVYDVASTTCGLIQIYFICTATDELAGTMALRPSGNLTWKAILVGSILAAVGAALSALEGMSVFLLVGGVVDIATVVLYMVFLFRAGRALRVPLPEGNW